MITGPSLLSHLRTSYCEMIMQEQTRILVVEDDSIIAMDIKIRLEKLEYNVVGTVTSGEDAIACVEKLSPNLILMDIVLKGELDGIATAQIITARHGTPIIFLTAFRDDADKFKRAKLTIPYGYITKPFDSYDLDVSIQLALVRREMEEKLVLKEKQYQLLMDNASCGLLISDENGIIIDINKEGALIFGETKDAILNRDFREFVTASEQEYAAVQIEKLQIEKRIGPNIGYILQPSGAIRDVVFSSVSVEFNGQSIVLSILDDTTEKNKILNEAILNCKMASIGTLALGIIHEINNPLNWLLSNLQFIKDKAKSLPIHEAKEHQLLNSFSEMLGEAIDGAETIAEIVHNLKSFAHVDNKSLVPVDIVRTLNAAIHIVEHEIKQIMQLKKEFCDDIPLLLLSSNRLQQVFINLIMNAAQSFSKPGDSNNHLIIKITRESNTLRIDFTDNGSGIEPKDMEQLFTPFFTTKPMGTGTGLGLSICYTIIHDMGGEITVKSVKKKGTCFSIVLPLNIKIKDQSIIKATPKTTSQLNILIIDDIPNALKTMHRLLIDEHFVTEALGGREALKILEQRGNEFDLVITDINMKDVNGMDLYRFIKQKYPQLADRIIFVTGGVFSEHVEKFLAGINNICIEKPFSSDDLYTGIATLYPPAKLE